MDVRGLHALRICLAKTVPYRGYHWPIGAVVGTDGGALDQGWTNWGLLPTDLQRHSAGTQSFPRKCIQSGVEGQACPARMEERSLPSLAPLGPNEAPGAAAGIPPSRPLDLIFKLSGNSELYSVQISLVQVKPEADRLARRWLKPALPWNTPRVQQGWQSICGAGSYMASVLCFLQVKIHGQGRPSHGCGGPVLSFPDFAKKRK